MKSLFTSLLLFRALTTSYAGLEQVLEQGESVNHDEGWLSFQNGKCKIHVQDNGKAVAYYQSSLMWGSGDPTPAVHGNYRLTMQGDGNLVIYSASGDVVYATHTAEAGTGNYFLAFDEECILGIYKGVIGDPNPESIWRNKIGILKRGERLGKGQILRFPGTNKFLYVQPADGNLLVKEGPEGDLRGEEVVRWASNTLASTGTQDYYLIASENGRLSMVGIADTGEYEYWHKDLGVGGSCYKVGLDGNNEPIALPCHNIEKVLGKGEALTTNDDRVYFHGDQCLVYLQDNGKFVTGLDRGFGNGAHHLTWHSGDPHNTGYPPKNYRIAMQEDGNLVVRLAGSVRSSTVYYATHTSGPVRDYFLGMADDCTVAIYQGRVTDSNPQAIWKSVKPELKRGQRLGRGELVLYPGKNAFLYIQPADGHLTVRQGTYLDGGETVLWAAGPLANTDTHDYFLQAANNGHLSLVGIGTNGSSDYEYWNKNLGFGRQCYAVELNDQYEPIGASC